MIYDLVVIGGGPGGYVCAIRASQLGLNVALVDQKERLGGTCLNIGCIPSKALLESSEHFYQLKNELKEHGINFSDLRVDLKQMMHRKQSIVDGLTRGITFLMKKNKVTVFQGQAKVLNSPARVEIVSSHKKDEIETKKIVIATGSAPISLPSIPFDGKYVISSTEALSLERVPARIGIVGGGVIGLELGSVWARLGSNVTVIELMNKIGGALDGECSEKLQQILEKQGFKFFLESKINSSQIKDEKIQLSFHSKNSLPPLEVDILLVAIGRRPMSENLGLEEMGIQKDTKGFIKVNDKYQTAHPDIYAIGDVIGGLLLAHKAEEEGVAVAEILSGRYGHVNYQTVPSIIYTFPEVASVGFTEEQLKTQNRPYRVGRFPFAANGRARCLGSPQGFVKIIADSQSDLILGAHILGPRASELISEIVIAMEFSASSEDLARAFHAHPTLSEAIREAALNVELRSRQM